MYNPDKKPDGKQKVCFLKKCVSSFIFSQEPEAGMHGYD